MNIFSNEKNYVNSNYNRSNLIGTILSIILTIIPFAIIMSHKIDVNISITVIILCAIFQIGTHLVYFLHLNTIIEQRWNIISLLFIILIISILIVGSLWIMFHLNHNLMNH